MHPLYFNLQTPCMKEVCDGFCNIGECRIGDYQFVSSARKESVTYIPTIKSNAFVTKFLKQSISCDDNQKHINLNYNSTHHIQKCLHGRLPLPQRLLFGTRRGNICSCS